MSFSIQLVALATLSRREFIRVLRIWVQTILPPVINAALYFMIFGNLIGGRIGTIDGFSYPQYIAPGLILMAVITNSYGNVVASFFGSKINRYLEELLISPMSNSIIVLGYMAGGMVRGTLVGSAVTLIALIFAPLPFAHPWVALSVCLVCSAIFSLGGFINGISAKTFDDVAIIPSFVLQPLIYLGGVFYSIRLLPQLAQDISQMNPILYLVNAFRFSILGVSDVPLGRSFLIMLGFLVLLFWVSTQMLKRGFRIRD